MKKAKLLLAMAMTSPTWLGFFIWWTIDGRAAIKVAWAHSGAIVASDTSCNQSAQKRAHLMAVAYEKEVHSSVMVSSISVSNQ